MPDGQDNCQWMVSPRAIRRRRGRRPKSSVKGNRGEDCVVLPPPRRLATRRLVGSVTECMEKYSSWRVSSSSVQHLRQLEQLRSHSLQDPATGIAPFVPPVPASTAVTPLAIRAVALPLAYALAGLRTLLVVLLLLLQFVLVEVLLQICVRSSLCTTRSLC